MPANWPELTLAAAVVLTIAFVVADILARAVEAVLRAILPGEHGSPFITRPKVIVRVVIFLIVAGSLAFPVLRLAGYDTDLTDPRNDLRMLLPHVLKIAAIIVMAYAVIRLGTAGARRFEQEMSTGTGLDVLERTKRAQTLGRLLQKTLTVVVVVVAALMILGVVGLDITPVLAGAGIVGLAVGFGAQTLVRDIISGFFIILEDQVRVGDVAVVNGQGGLVEALNLRTIVLRDESGAVHVVPNGEVRTLSNLTKDFSFYVILISVPSHEDPDEVIAALLDASAALQGDPEYQPHILAPLEVLGVDDFQPGHIVIKARIKTVPLKQWFVGRALRKRIAAVFKERGIELPMPQMQVRMPRSTGGGAGGG